MRDAKTFQDLLPSRQICSIFPDIVAKCLMDAPNDKVVLQSASACGICPLFQDGAAFVFAAISLWLIALVCSLAQHASVWLYDFALRVCPCLKYMHLLHPSVWP